MYFNNLKKIRNEYKYTQEYVAKKIKCKRTTYNNWEQGVVMIPIEILDKLSLLYNVKISYLLGIDKDFKINYKIKKLNYNTLLKNLLILKRKNKQKYDEIAVYLNCTGATCQRYYNGIVTIPMDRLILLSQLYKIDIDKLCGKIF